MLINLTELLSGTGVSKVFTAEIDMNEFPFDLGVYQIVDKKPVELTITNTGKDKLEVKGEVILSLYIPCDRCLEEVKTPIRFSLEREIDMSVTDMDGIKESEEQDYIVGCNLDVDKFVYRDILMNIPTKILCREDCKGLCIKCGNNLNEKECGCDRSVLDLRMSAVQDIFNSYKEVE